MNTAQYQAWLPIVADAAREAGKAIMAIYRCPECEIEKKADGSPVTLADKNADQVIRRVLETLTPHIPVVSEESLDQTPFFERQNWSSFWLVDPLDGTKEFIERTGEFCVNIGLVIDYQPVLGVVYAPVSNVLYTGVKGGEATRTDRKGSTAIRVDNTINMPVRVAVSRRHGNGVKRFIEALGQSQTVFMGSALKSCLVAEGRADVYPRFGPTSHWDTAASQAIVEAAGGRIVDSKGRDLTYRPSESLLNPFFMVIGSNSHSWPTFS
jgi:3'(2'), 5'-bisphosphate nucleotidase